ncbi:MAG: flagellar export chaperone FliS [Phycisphaeraceae bacterium]|nr:MAG: flagellar export chaperone FliS [Phycisphaeraceae bacterium]
MSIDVNNPYFRTKVLTASQEELRLLLIEGALRFARTGRDGLASKDFEKVFEGFSQARDIVSELLTGLRPDQAPEMCTNLSAIYNYIFRLLVRASLEKDLAAADEAIQRLEYERETWVMVMEKLAQERTGKNGAPAEMPNAPAPERPATYAPPKGRSPLSISG